MSAVLPDGTKFEGPAGLRSWILKQPEQFASALTERLVIYALGRGFDLLRERPRGRGVALADVGGQDQDALRSVLVAEQAQVGLAFAPSHHGK